MKNHLLKSSIVLALSLFSFGAFAQAYEEGKFIVQAGYGFPNWGKTLLKTSIVNSNATNVSALGFGPIHARAEYALTDRFGMGISFNFNSYGFTWTEQQNVYNSTTGLYEIRNYDYTVKVTSPAILVRFNRHWEVNDKVDAYWGMGTGWNGAKYTFTSNDPNYNTESLNTPFPVAFEITFGMKYYFTENIGFYIEAGYAKSILQGGFCARF